MADWSREASEYLDGYLKQVAVLIRARGDDVDEVIAGLRDHIANELESDGGGTVTLDRLLGVMGRLGSVEDVANIETVPLKSTPAAAPPAPPKAPPAVPKVTKTVVVHRSAASCVIAVILAAGAALAGLAVLSIIAAIVLPALVQSREAARRGSCQNNLKQLGVSLQNIAADDGQFPTVDLSYVGVMFDVDEIDPESINDLEMFICPSGPNAEHGITEDDSENTFNYDYVYISHVITDAREGLAYLDAVAEAKRTATPLDGPITLEDGRVLPRVDPRGSTVPSSQVPIMIERPGHHVPEGFNVLFLDGHVEFIRLGDGDGVMWSPEFVEALENANTPD